MTLREKIETLALQASSKPGRSSEFRERLIGEAGVGPDTKVLDMATAVGGMAFAARDKTQHVTAIDLSEERVELAKNDPRARDIRFMLMDAAHTDFADDEFDVAFVVLGLHEMTINGAREALREARRIAKRLIVVEFGLDEWPLFWSFFRYPLALFEPSGFLKFTRYNIADLIENAGWSITAKRATFPFVTYLCS